MAVARTVDAQDWTRAQSLARAIGPVLAVIGLSATGSIRAQDPADSPPPPGLDVPDSPVPDLGSPPDPLPLAPIPGPFEGPEVSTPPRIEPVQAPLPVAGGLRIGDMVEVVGDPTEELTLVIGQSRIFDLTNPVSRVLVSNPAIAGVRFLDPEVERPRLLDVFGIAFGTTILTVWDDAGRPTSIRLRVTIDTQDLEARITKIFPGADLSITQVGPQIILDGQVADPKTMAEVLQIVQSTLLGDAAAAGLGQGFAGGGSGGGGQGGRGGGNSNPLPPPAVRQTNYSPDSRTTRASQIPENGQLLGPIESPVPDQGFGVPGGAVGVPGVPGLPLGPSGLGIPAVQGFTTADPYAALSPRSGGGSLPAGTIVNRVRVPGPRQVLLKVKIAEVNRTAIRQLGVNFQRITAGDTINSIIGNIGPSGSQLFGIFDEGNFSLFINALRQNNLAKILAEPNLVTLDGQPAEFVAGGRFPYPVPQSATIPGGGTVVTIQFAEFGAILQFLPTILDDQSIRLDVSPVFSELNFGAGTAINGTTVPGINERSARTVVQLREGQTLAIAGLLQTRTNAITARVPLLGDIPIFGQLFSSNTINTLETELVVLVTPELISPLDPDEVPPTPGDRLWEPNDWEFYLLGRIEGRTGYPFRATLQELDPLQIMRHNRSEKRWVVGPSGYAD